jgi:predicted RNA-binding Zn-ribbon protein involved in translation (DUF1610 family)
MRAGMAASPLAIPAKEATHSPGSTPIVSGALFSVAPAGLSMGVDGPTVERSIRFLVSESVVVRDAASGKRKEKVAYLSLMPESHTTRFNCPTCGAEYQVVRLDWSQQSVDREITCKSCGAPLQGRDGRFLLKYFLVRRR